MNSKIIRSLFVAAVLLQGTIAFAQTQTAKVLGPVNGAMNQSISLNAVIKAAFGATTSTLEINDSSNFTGSGIIRSGGTVQAVSGLNYATQYFTRVKTNIDSTYGMVTTFSTADASYFAYVI